MAGRAISREYHLRAHKLIYLKSIEKHVDTDKALRVATCNAACKAKIYDSL